MRVSGGNGRRYPRFKSRKRSKASATFTTSGCRYKDGQVTLAKMVPPLDIRWSCPLPEGAEPSTVTVSRDAAGRWHISILVECPVETLPPVAATVGIDAGITALVTLSTGEKVTNPEHEKAGRERLTLAQRRLSRTTKGSGNRARARLKVARVHAQLADRRRDHLHKLSTRIIRENQTVVIEDPTVRNMVRNHHLARASSGAARAEFRQHLEYKAGWHGRTVTAVDRFCPSGKRCSACGQLAAKMPLNIREWVCAACGVLHDRDVNAAKVILAGGLSAAACGDGVRPPRT